MEQLLTANVASNMYWLGRYLERVEATLYQIDKAFDKIIDVDKNAGVELYQKFGINIEYSDAMDFLRNAICGEHPANLATIMNNARESAIISRSNIDASAFGEIIALEGLFRKLSNGTLPVDYKDIDHALSLLREIWGAYTSRGHQKRSDYFLKLGKLVEEVDLRLRLDKNLQMTRLVLEDINNMFNLISPGLDITVECPKQRGEDTQENIMDCIYKAVDKLIILD
jgi:uncharacterized alpha-E superfamily protein